MESMGTVKWFDPRKGYGFIIPDEGGLDCLVHYSQIKKRGYRKLNEGERVKFICAPGKNGRMRANDVVVLRDDSVLIEREE